jgi:hypothetical protein
VGEDLGATATAAELGGPMHNCIWLSGCWSSDGVSRRLAAGESLLTPLQVFSHLALDLIMALFLSDPFDFALGDLERPITHDIFRPKSRFHLDRQTLVDGSARLFKNQRLDEDEKAALEGLAGAEPGARVLLLLQVCRSWHRY